MPMPMITLEDLQARFAAAADPVTRNSLRQRGRAAALKAGVAIPEWCARQRGVRAAPPLTAPIEAQTGPVALPVYDSLRAWAKAAPGATSRVVCWHPQADGAMHVSLVELRTDADRKRSPTYTSEAAALEAIAAGTVRWASPRAAADRRRNIFQT